MHLNVTKSANANPLHHSNLASEVYAPIPHTQLMQWEEARLRLLTHAHLLTPSKKLNRQNEAGLWAPVKSPSILRSQWPPTRSVLSGFFAMRKRPLKSWALELSRTTPVVCSQMCQDCDTCQSVTTRGLKRPTYPVDQWPSSRSAASSITSSVET